MKKLLSLIYLLTYLGSCTPTPYAASKYPSSNLLTKETQDPPKKEKTQEKKSTSQEYFFPLSISVTSLLSIAVTWFLVRKHYKEKLKILNQSMPVEEPNDNVSSKEISKLSAENSNLKKRILSLEEDTKFLETQKKQIQDLNQKIKGLEENKVPIEKLKKEVQSLEKYKTNFEKREAEIKKLKSKNESLEKDKANLREKEAKIENLNKQIQDNKDNLQELKENNDATLKEKANEIKSLKNSLTQKEKDIKELKKSTELYKKDREKLEKKEFKIKELAKKLEELQRKVNAPKEEKKEEPKEELLVSQLPEKKQIIDEFKKLYNSEHDELAEKIAKVLSKDNKNCTALIFLSLVLPTCEKETKEYIEILFKNKNKEVKPFRDFYKSHKESIKNKVLDKLKSGELPILKKMESLDSKRSVLEKIQADSGLQKLLDTYIERGIEICTYVHLGNGALKFSEGFENVYANKIFKEKKFDKNKMTCITTMEPEQFCVISKMPMLLDEDKEVIENYVFYMKGATKTYLSLL